MIGSLKGTVEHTSGETLLIDVNGVGYEVTCTRTAMEQAQPGKLLQLCVHTDVKEDSIRLFGFADRAERQVFSLLLKVSGLGPRSAVDILSALDKTQLLRTIGAGDIEGLTRIRGVGKKKAERIVVELRDLVGKFSEEIFSPLAGRVEVEVSGGSMPGGIRDAVAALEVLGFSRRDAEQAVRNVPGHAELESGELIREALRYV